MEFAKYKLWFKEYVHKFYSKNEQDQENIRLKEEHSYRVLKNAQAIAHDEGLNSRLYFLTSLAALFHDIGRFEQYSRFKTFNDKLSVDHARLGNEILKREEILNNLSFKEARNVLIAVLLHNRLSLPLKLPPNLLTISQIVRDADKLDIFPVVLSYVQPGGKENRVVTLGLRDEPEAFSVKVLEQVQQGRLANYTDMVYINDFKLLLLSWVFDLNFAFTCREVLAKGYVHSLIELLPQTDLITRLKEDLISYLSGKIKAKTECIC
ncbi:HD domain-containing protein [Desulfohalobiaceae bacterium Ax17]|uniref:HD domain-containing protein n=1 Tax=Desulfovulcanus ferrireducens TaxID=2831190 RepID=UPI00207BCBA1|nr:HD domain-containing protein [Desulfovulcanus ferrireducens]MBT8764090.1 HD domain-containing protein [Desulfovulcanus ferrireducens]